MRIKKFFLNLLVLTTTLIICFFFLEVFFTYNIKFNKASTTAVNLPIFEKSNYRSWGLKPNAYARQGFEDPVPEIRINSIGLREDEIPEEKTKNRILFLGDSFVFGMGANQDQTMSKFLNSFYTGEKYTKTINAGVIGHTIDDAFLYLKYDGIKLKPDIVIYNFFVGNDITELRRHKQVYSDKGELILTEDIEHYINDQGFLRKKGKTEPKSYFLFWLNNKLFETKQDATLTWPIFFSDDDSRGDEFMYKHWGVFVETLKQMDSYCKKNNLKFLVNIIPMDVQISKRYWGKYPNMPFGEEEFFIKRPQKRITSILNDLNIDYVDLLPKLQEIDEMFEREDEDKFLYYTRDPHFNKWGNKWTANSIYLHLINNGYIN